ncbi:MAG: hypothetical protein ABFD92_10500 [Planctomycetaceae bacterium]|nr:hypothetical protein [Planctomycetaceae bacterium]
MKPRIIKLGTVDCDMVEVRPVVWKDALYRFEYVRPNYWDNATGDSYFRFVEHDSGAPSEPFARGYHLGNVWAEGDLLIVTGTNIWDGERVDIFTSRDMKTWQTWNALNLSGYGIFNTSLCRGPGYYVLMFEINKPKDICGVPFTARFATSTDLKRWDLTSNECRYEPDRYTAPHCLRYLDGWYYNFYLESIGGGYEQYVVRSRDLAHWEKSPHNPVLVASDEDRKIINPRLPKSLHERVATAKNLNNSDIDFVEFRGRTIINYSWGNQEGIEHLAEAVYEGTEADFLRGWFS